MKGWWWTSLVVSMAWANPWYYMNDGQAVPLKPLQPGASLRSTTGKLHFLDPRGHELVIGNRLIVKFRSIENLRNYLDRFGLTIVKKYGFSGMYLLEAATPEAAIDAANALYHAPDVLFAQPDIARKVRLR